MTHHVTFGSNIKRTKGERTELGTDLVYSLVNRLVRDPGEPEAWWSGHLWADDDRRKPVQWEGASVLVVDVDHYSNASTAKERHTPPPEPLRTKLEKADVPCSFWHHTPRGARFVFVLEELSTDAEAVQEGTRGAGAMINACLREKGACASMNARGKPVGGYFADVATFDLARLMYRPNTTVNGVERRADLVVMSEEPFAIEDLRAFKDDVSAVPSSEVALVLSKMKAEGENDGSLELIKVAARAVRLGVMDAATFKTAVAQWNSKRVRPWSEEDLERRFEDALERYRDEKLVPVTYDDKGRPLYTTAVLDRILREDSEYEGAFRLNEMGVVIELRGEDFKNSDYHVIRCDIIERYGFTNVPKADVIDAVERVASENAYHPVREWLNGLEWDGEERLDDFAANVVGNDKAIVSRYWRRWFIGAVARVMQPGCKVDTVLTLVGPQGHYKSTLFRELAGDDNFIDTHVDISDKDARLTLARCWVYEFSELDGLFKKADITAIRSFLSQNYDDVRPPYERVTRRLERHWIAVATSNPPDIARDDEGTRRFWIMEVGEGALDIEYVREHRDQLWAEAVDAFHSNEQWWLTPAEDQVRAEENEAFRPEDPLADSVFSVLNKIEDEEGADVVITTKLICAKIMITPSPATMSKISSVLRAAGWKQGVRRIDGRQQRVWSAPNEESDT